MLSSFSISIELFSKKDKIANLKYSSAGDSSINSLILLTASSLFINVSINAIIDLYSSYSFSTN